MVTLIKMQPQSGGYNTVHLSLSFFQSILFFLKIEPILCNRAHFLVRNIPVSNEIWSHNFFKDRVVLDS